MALVLPDSCRENTDSGDDTCQELLDARCVLENYMTALLACGAHKRVCWWQFNAFECTGSRIILWLLGFWFVFTAVSGGKKVKISRSLEGKQAIRQCHFFPLTGLLTLGFSVQLWLSLFLWHVTSTEPRLEYVIWHEIKGDTPEETVQQKVTCAKVEHNHTPWGNTKLQKHRQWFPNI